MAQPAQVSTAESRTAGRRGRPTADRALAIDADIRAAALTIFLDIGFEAASMDAIAASAAVSKGTLYARYESKDWLFRAVIEEEMERLSDRAGEMDHLLPPDIEGRLRHHARMVVDIFEWPQFRALDRLMRSVRAFPELDRLWQEVATVRYVGFLTLDIAKAADARDVSRADCVFFANLFVHAIMGWHREEAQQRVVDAAETIAFADRVIDMIVAEIRRATAVRR